MAQSLSNVLLHLVFSTKNRHPWIDIEIEEELIKYLAGTCRDIGCPSHKIGCADDHIHYGAFSIGQSQLPDLKHYIGNQREHHRRVSYQDKYRQMLARYQVEYDERYVWD